MIYPSSFCSTLCQYAGMYLSVQRTLLAVVLLLLGSSIARSQNDAQAARGMSMTDYDKAKTFKLNDIDNDTYVKFDNAYVLDRYEMKPPYVFKYSDNIERRFYLYKLLDNQTRKDLGMVAIYYLPASKKSINLPIPNATADKQVWARYIDDLKELGEKESGFLSAFSYTLSREVSIMMGAGSGQASPVSQSKIDYDVCFPSGTPVTLLDGSQVAIETLKAGDRIAAYNQKTGQLETTIIKNVEVHESKDYAVTSVMAVRREVVTVSVNNNTNVMGALRLEATSNHPVLTKSGRKQLGELVPGDVIYCYDSTQETFAEFEVRVIAKDFRTVSQVYNLVTDKQNFLVNHAVVLDK
jgi:hypothetical protein